MTRRPNGVIAPANTPCGHYTCACKAGLISVPFIFTRSRATHTHRSPVFFRAVCHPPRTPHPPSSRRLSPRAQTQAPAFCANTFAAHLCLQRETRFLGERGQSIFLKVWPSRPSRCGIQKALRSLCPLCSSRALAKRQDFKVRIPAGGGTHSLALRARRGARRGDVTLWLLGCVCGALAPARPRRCSSSLHLLPFRPTRRVVSPRRRVAAKSPTKSPHTDPASAPASQTKAKASRLDQHESTRHVCCSTHAHSRPPARPTPPSNAPAERRLNARRRPH